MQLGNKNTNTQQLGSKHANGLFGSKNMRKIGNTLKTLAPYASAAIHLAPLLL